MSEPGEVTQLLRAYREGDREAFDRLVPIVYQDLRRVARRQLRRRLVGDSLDTIGLVHEAWFKLVDESGADYRDRGHFLAVSARAMRQVIIDHARQRHAAKRGGGQAALPLDEERIPVQQQTEQLLALDQALERIEARQPRLARVVECRYFAGLSEAETAEALGVSVRTAERDWKRARAWLLEELRGGSKEPGG